MKNILDEIVAVKQKEVEYAKSFADLDWYKHFSDDFDKECISLKQNLLKENSTGIIAEFKRKSPSKGWFKDADYSAPAIVMCYEQYGAAGASVLTDTEFFGGDLPDITVCRAVTALPILRKDFIIDEIQVMQAKAYGADVILLIAAILSTKRVKELAAEAKKYGMEVLLELHGENELGHICDEIDMVGINNRNLQTFEVDIQHSIRLSKRLPDDKVKIAESGIDDVETIKVFKDAGFKGFLIGEKFMKQPHPGTAFEQFVQKLKQG
jgi:indole-3-glycerol phosphate synthase